MWQPRWRVGPESPVGDFSEATDSRIPRPERNKYAFKLRHGRKFLIVITGEIRAYRTGPRTMNDIHFQQQK